MTDWLAGQGCHDDVADDLVYAASEAVSNSVEHAFVATSVGVTTLEATALRTEFELTRIAITVTGSGIWRSPPTDTGDRGRRLSMIAGLVEDLRIEVTNAGTRVHMTGRPC